MDGDWATSDAQQALQQTGLLKIGGWSSAVAIGPRVLVTAAHTVGRHGTVTTWLDGERRVFSCKKHSAYSKKLHRGDRLGIDLALCQDDQQPPLAMCPLPVVLDSERLAVGSEVRLSGIGCQKCNDASLSPTQYSSGRTTVASLPEAGRRALVTKGESAICRGDSGGGVLMESEGGGLSVVAVATGSLDCRKRISAAATLSWPENANWIRTWAQKPGRDICGVSSAPDACSCDS